MPEADEGAVKKQMMQMVHSLMVSAETFMMHPSISRHGGYRLLIRGLRIWMVKFYPTLHVYDYLYLNFIVIVIYLLYIHTHYVCIVRYLHIFWSNCVKQICKDCWLRQYICALGGCWQVCNKDPQRKEWWNFFGTFSCK